MPHNCLHTILIIHSKLWILYSSYPKQASNALGLLLSYKRRRYSFEKKLSENKKQVFKTHAKHRTYMTHDNADQGKSIRSRFPLRMWDITKLALSATSFPFTRADSRHEARSFTSCSTRQRNALPLSPALFESRRSIPARGTCALRYLRDTSISGPRLGRVLSSTWPRASPATHEITGRPFLFPTWGSSVSARPRLAPHPRGHRLRGPSGDKEPDPCLRPPVSTLDDGRLPLSPPGLPITHLFS